MFQFPSLGATVWTHRYLYFCTKCTIMLTSSFINSFGDKRLDARGNKFVSELLLRGTHSKRQISQDSAG